MSNFWVSLIFIHTTLYVYVYAVPWSEFPVIPSYPNYAQTLHAVGPISRGSLIATSTCRPSLLRVHTPGYTSPNEPRAIGSCKVSP